MSLLAAFERFLLVAGYAGLFAGVFVETGLLIGLALPGGETLVFAAGFLSSLGYLNIWLVVAVTFLAAVFADSLEYYFGKKYGQKMFDRERPDFFKKEHIESTRKFYARYGGMAIVVSRFVPFVRTLAPAFAGVGNMPYATFVFYNVAGGALWAGGVSLLGYFLGRAIPNADRYAALIIGAVAAASIASFFLAAWLRGRRAS